MIYYELLKVIIDISSLAKVIINMVIHYYGVLKLIVMDQNLLLISKF